MAEATKPKFPRWLREALAAHPKVVCERQIMSGAPCVVGRRIGAHILAGRYAAGESMKEIADDYEISLEDVAEAIRFTIRTSRIKSTHFWKFWEAQ